jgi:hypothetical protein
MVMNSVNTFLSKSKSTANLISLYVIFLFGTFFVVTADVNASEQEKPTDVIYKLYKDFAWQAFMDQDENSSQILGKSIAYQSREILERYFDPALAALFIEDVKFSNLTGDEGSLSFDPIFASQDPDVTSLKVSPYSSGKILVQYVSPPGNSKKSLIYIVKKFSNGWRITDIVYDAELNNASLKKTLQQTETSLKIWKKQEELKKTK